MQSNLFTTITDEESEIMLVTLVEGFTDEDGRKHPPIEFEKAYQKVEHFDNMLTIQRNKSLLTRKRGLKKDLDKYIRTKLL